MELSQDTVKKYSSICLLLIIFSLLGLILYIVGIDEEVKCFQLSGTCALLYIFQIVSAFLIVHFRYIRKLERGKSKTTAKIFEICFAIYYIVNFLPGIFKIIFKKNLLNSSSHEIFNLMILIAVICISNIAAGYLNKSKIHYFLALFFLLMMPVLNFVLESNVWKESSFNWRIRLGFSVSVPNISILLDFLFLWLAYFIKLRTMKKKEIAETEK